MQGHTAIYHKDCIDGTAAAAIFLRKFPDSRTFALGHYYSVDEMSPVVAAARASEHVYTLDCVIGVEDLLNIGIKVTAIDHHIGAKERFEKMAAENPGLSYIFNNDKSGCSLTWAYFFPDEGVPEMVRYIEDSDLWRWQYGQVAKDVNNYLHMLRNDPHEMLRIIESGAEEAKAKGAVLSEYIDREIQIISKRHGIMIKIGDHEIPCFNITGHEHQSECGNILSEKHEKAVALFTLEQEIAKISFRSINGQEPSALALAVLLGGGGHNNAAGAVVKLKDFLGMIVLR